MFRATMCPSSGEKTVFMRHMVLVILCKWLERVEKRNKHTKKNCAPSWFYLQDYKQVVFGGNQFIHYDKWSLIITLMQRA